MRFSVASTTIHLRRSPGQKWEAWEEREASCEFLGSAPISDVRAAYDRLIQAMNDDRPGPSQRWLMDTGKRSRQLVVRLDEMMPELLLLDGDAAGLPVVFRWPIRSRRLGVTAPRG